MELLDCWIEMTFPRPAPQASLGVTSTLPFLFLVPVGVCSFLVLRDLTELKAEHVRLSGSLLTCCLRLTVGAPQSRESDGSGRLNGSEPSQLMLLLARTQELEKEAHERSQELTQLKSQGHLEKAELQDR